MSDPLDPSIDDCGCCEGIQAATPVELENPPGQDTLALRVGTHGRFLRSQLAVLSSQPALETLTVRSTDDPAIALLDAWSSVLDVLGFYQERIGNEGYLRTAVERRSILEVGRSIGYELRPGVAASTFFAFTLETAPGAPTRARIYAGTRAQSVPAQDAQAQVYETVETLDARGAWNALEVLAYEQPVPRWGDDTIWLRGQSTRLVVGDALLIVGDERLEYSGSEAWDFRKVARIQIVPPAVPSADPLAGTTIVTLDRKLGSLAPHVEPAKRNPRVHALRTRANLFGYNAPDWKAMPAALRANYQGIDQPDLALITEQAEWPGYTLSELSEPPPSSRSGTGLLGEYFAGKQFNQRKFERTDATVAFDWGAGSPDPRLAGDHFSVRWTGWVRIPTGGVYTFTTRSDDGVRLWIDNDLVIDQWAAQVATNRASTPIERGAGQKVEIRLEYFEETSAASCQLMWTGPGIAKSIVPTSALYPRNIFTVLLDQPQPKVVAGSWLVMTIPEYEELYQVVSTVDDAGARFTLTGKTTRLVLKGERLYELFDRRLRDTAVFADSNELAWATRPLSGLLTGNAITLAGLEPDLGEKRWIAVDGGVLADVPANAIGGARLAAGDALAALEMSKDGRTATVTFVDGARFALALEARSEVVAVRRNDTTVDGRTQLQLEADLEHAYLPSTVRLNANVATATHGDSKRMAVQAEILGSGNGSLAFQRFTLQQPPLTYVSAATPTGTASTLEIRVDGVRWREAETITELGPDDRAYLVRRSDDGKATVQFGDGIHGARLPSGQNNVTARYRVGIGAAGNVADHTISVLMTRPLGVKDVTNAVSASGGTDAESGDRARRNTPLTVLTLERIVSLRDFEDFAAAFAGIGKAQAVWLWNGESRIVHLTVCGIDGTDIDPASALYRNLQAAIDAVRPGHQALTMAPGTVVRFGLVANVCIDPAYETDPVMAAMRAALEQDFGFDARGFGESVSGSELVATMQRVPGVAWVDLDTIAATSAGTTITADGPDGRLRAWRARWQEGTSAPRILPAQLLLIDPTGLVLREVGP